MFDIKFTTADRPAIGKLADAELVFHDGTPLAGLRLIGFAVWERRTGKGRNVTFPARQYSINGERRSFAVLRPVADTKQQQPITEQILAAYAAEYDQPTPPPPDDPALKF